MSLDDQRAMTPSLRHALVLTAGLGTRLRPLTSVRAKPAVPLAGVPLIERIIRWLVSQRVTNLVLNLHHLPETIARLVGDGHHLGACVRYSWEQPTVLGSAGGPRLAAPVIGADPFLIVNGDTLTDVNLDALAADHARSGALVTMALVPNRDPDHYGGVRLDRQARVTGFARRGPEAVGSFHFIGVQVAAADAFRAIPPGSVANSVGDAYDQLLACQPGGIRGFLCDAPFWDIGSVADYWRTSLAFADATDRAERAGGGIAERAVTATLGRGDDVRIAPTARVRRSILWDHIRIGPSAVVDGCIVTDRVSVPAGARYQDVILSVDDRGRLLVTPIPIR